jgi:hypothetical protein
MKSIKIIVLIVIFGVFFVSCESKTYNEIATVTNPKYSPNIKAIMSSKCTTCHSSSSATQEEPYLETYAEVKEAIQNTDLLCLIEDPVSCSYEAADIMPPTGKIPQATIDVIKLWATNDYPQ